MKQKITRVEAQVLMDKYLKTPQLRLHSRETEVIMRRLAEHLEKDEEFWGITGFLHDLDLDVIGSDIQRHGSTTCELLKENGYDLPVMEAAIFSHVEGIDGVDAHRQSPFEFILAGAENLTGLISAYVILRPEKKIEGTKVKSIKKKFKSPAFAAKVNRQFIQDAADHANMELGDFIALGIEAMSEISDELGM